MTPIAAHQFVNAIPKNGHFPLATNDRVVIIRGVYSCGLPLGLGWLRQQLTLPVIIMSNKQKSPEKVSSITGGSMGRSRIGLPPDRIALLPQTISVEYTVTTV